MFAKEVKRLIRDIFETACQVHGFRRTKRGGLGWYHPLDDHYFVIAFRTPREWNRHWGGFLECKMRIQDQINPRFAELRKPLERSIVSLASEADRETMRHWYNETAARTTVPEETVDHLTALERKLCEMLRVPLHAPLSAACDSELLLRFRAEEDVRRWAKFILYRLPEWMEEMTAQWRSWYGSTGRDMTPHQPFLLKRLSVADNPDLGIEGIACLLEAEFAPRLEVLAVGCGWFDDYLVRQLAESQLSSTIRLSMKHGFIGFVDQSIGISLRATNRHGLCAEPIANLVGRTKMGADELARGI